MKKRNLLLRKLHLKGKFSHVDLNLASEREFQLIYPNRNTKIYIPTDFGKPKGQTIFHAIHQNSKARLFWHLNHEYVGETRMFHEKGIQIEPGIHEVTVVDEKGTKISREFEVIGKENPQSKRTL